jgi:hypothetical protein
MKRFFCFATCCMLLLCAAPFARAQVPGRLIGWWKLDDATNATLLADSSGNNRNATKGVGVSIVTGKFGAAARFDGTGDAWASFNTPVLTNMTIAAWVYMDGIPPNILPRIMQIGPDTYFLMPSNSPSQIGTVALGVQSNGWATGISDVKFSLNKWFHTALVYRQEYTNATDRVVSAVLYINGIRCGDQSGGKTAFKTAIPASTAFIGNNSAGAGLGVRPLNGMMDDVRLYNAPLSDKDVFALYQNRLLVIDAGKDLTCCRADALLQGRVASTNTFTRDLTASLAWSTVSAPGGATPVIQTSWLPVSPVTLPEAGTYTFRLTASNELGVVSDDVTVVRSTDAPPVGNAAPTLSPLWTSTNIVLGTGAPLAVNVSDDGKPTNTVRVCWSKVSGPGAVFFDNAFTNTTTAYFSTNGTYVVQLEADDGALTKVTNVTVNVALPAGNLSDGLLHWWRMDDDPGLKKTFDSAGSNTLSFTFQAVLQPGKTGNGFRAPTYHAVAQAATVLTNADTMTFSTWLYYDSAFTNNATMRIFYCGANFRILYNRDASQIDLSTYTLTNAADFGWSFSNQKLATNQWYHIAVLFDRRAAASGSKQVMYLNGVRYLSAANNNYFIGAAAFTSPFLIGNNGTDGTRNFDGVLDEMRVYNRFITDEEARLLATDPDNNHAPVIEGPTNLIAKVGRPVAFQSVAIDDGQPFGKTLTTGWSVASGDTAKVLFTDASKLDTTATFTKTGTYVIKLSASDSELQAAAFTLVTVLPTGTILTVW